MAEPLNYAVIKPQAYQNIQKYQKHCPTLFFFTCHNYAMEAEFLHLEAGIVVFQGLHTILLLQRDPSHHNN